MKYMILAASLLAAMNCFSGTATGKVDKVFVRDSDGLTYFTLKDATVENKPACATNAYWMIKDENSESGKKQYSMILAAQASGKKVQVVGYNTCTRWGDGEDVNVIIVLSEQ